MLGMRAVNLRSIDLNLLMPLYALLKERSVTRAGQEIHLSQPATSRALERLRDLLADDLLIRSRGKYQLTTRGESLLQELELVLPRLERLWRGEPFVPSHSTERLRLCMTDFACSLLLPRLMRILGKAAPAIRIEVIPWQEHRFESAAAGSLDLVFSPIAAPASLHVERLFEESFVCLVAEDHPFRRKQFGLKNYLEHSHIAIETQAGQQTFVDRPLAEAGYRRRITLQVPFFSSGVLALPGTQLVLTAPRRLARDLAGKSGVRTIQAPSEIHGFPYSMMWHPRLDNEPLHLWFRQIVQQVCAELG